MIQGKVENLIAIGAATAANCIPCFEHLYEKAINAGLTQSEIKRASDIAGQVKKGAFAAIENSVNEIIGSNSTDFQTCTKSEDPSCSC